MTYLFIWRMGKRSHGDFDITHNFSNVCCAYGFRHTRRILDWTNIMTPETIEVEWTETTPLHRIPEIYWSEDLSLLDKLHKGVVIGVVKSFFGQTNLIIKCNDGKIREVEAEIVKVI